MKKLSWVMMGLTLGVAACAGNKPQDPQAKIPVVVRHPPEVPPARDEPRDQILRQNARQEIEQALSSNDEIIRAHGIEAAKDGLGTDGRKLVLRGLTDTSPVVRFTAAAAVGDLQLA